MVARTVLALLFGLTLLGCAKKVAPPDAVYRQFFDMTVRYTRTPAPAYQAEAFRLLTRASQDVYRERALALNASLPEGAKPLEPHELLVVRKTPLGVTLNSVEIESQTADRTVLHVTLDGGDDRVTLRLEDGQWRVSLFEPSQAP